MRHWAATLHHRTSDSCSAHWAQQNPPPDPTPWAEIRDPAERLRAALGELYPWYRRSERMISNILRDIEMPVVAKMFGAIASASRRSCSDMIFALRGSHGAHVIASGSGTDNLPIPRSR